MVSCVTTLYVWLGSSPALCLGFSSIFWCQQIIWFPGMLWPPLITLLHCAVSTPTSPGVLSTLGKARQLYTHPAPIQSTMDWVPSHTCVGLNPCCFPQESIHKEVLNASPILFSAGTSICLSWDTQYCVILIFRWAMTMKKKKIHLIFTVNKIHFVLLPPSSSLHWVFTDSRICYRVLVGNSSSVFTVSAGDITASHSLNSWFFLCLFVFFPSPTFPLASITQLESTWMFKLLLRQTLLLILSVQRY